MTRTLHALQRRALVASCLLLTPALLLSGGCGVNKTPQISSIRAQPECGIVATKNDGTYLLVEFSATITGGDPFGDPTGFNIPVEGTWDFGDGTTQDDASLVLHKYTSPGEYTVTLTVRDKDGDEDSRQIKVLAVGENEAVETSSELLSFTSRVQADTISSHTAVVRGSLGTGCPSSGLGVQYLWSWDFGDGTPPVLHSNQVSHIYKVPPSARIVDVVLRVTETSADVSSSSSFQLKIGPRQLFNLAGQADVPSSVGGSLTMIAKITSASRATTRSLPMNLSAFQYTLVVSDLTLDADGPPQGYSGGTVSIFEDASTVAVFTDPATFSDGEEILTGNLIALQRSPHTPARLGAVSGTVEWTGGTRFGNVAAPDHVGWTMQASVDSTSAATGFGETWSGSTEAFRGLLDGTSRE